MLSIKNFKSHLMRVATQYDEDFHIDTQELVGLRNIVCALVEANMRNEPSIDVEDSPSERYECVLHSFFDPEVTSDGYAELVYMSTLPHYEE